MPYDLDSQSNNIYDEIVRKIEIGDCRLVKIKGLSFFISAYFVFFSIIMLIFVCENNLSWRTKPLIDIRTRSWETIQSSILRCMRIGRMTDTSPELFKKMYVTASVSVRYKRLQD